MTAVPVIQGTNWYSVNGTQPPLVTFPNPPRVNGDYQFVIWGTQISSGDTVAPTNNAGMVVVGAPWGSPTPANRTHLFYGLPIPSITGAPTTVQFTRGSGAAGARQVLAAMTIRGVHMTASVAAASTALAALSTVTVTVAALTAPEDNCLAIASFSTTWNATIASGIVTPPAGWTYFGEYTEPVGATTAVARNIVYIFTKEIDAGSSGTCACVFNNVPVQATGQMALLRPAADVAPGRTYPAPATVTGGVKSYGKFAEYS